MESRILAISTRVLIESVLNCGLAISGNRINFREANKTDATFINTAAREVAGTHASARREILYVLADAWTTLDRYVVETANALARFRRAGNAAAQASAGGLIAKLRTPGRAHREKE